MGPFYIHRHPKGTQARVLLTSVFGPYAQDDEYGSRVINPMELYHNQVTREQGSFSLRMFHRSWGLMMIQQNISAPSTLLDFPTLLEHHSCHSTRNGRRELACFSPVTRPKHASCVCRQGRSTAAGKESIQHESDSK